MQHRPQSVLQSFEDQITAEKSQLEAQAASLPPGPQNSLSRQRVAYVSRITAADLNSAAYRVVQVHAFGRPAEFTGAFDGRVASLRPVQAALRGAPCDPLALHLRADGSAGL
jgi:hypothetical protein